MPHLTLEKLNDYAAGRLTESEISSVSDHLDFCQECQSSLSTLKESHDSIVEGLKGVDAAAIGDQPEIDAVITAAQQIVSLTTQHGSRELTVGLDKAAVIPDDYEILEQIGEGGMGMVYAARHKKLDRTVALKILRTDHIARPEFIARFMQELKAIGKLDHPNIVRAHDAREFNGHHFLIMELLAGLDLSELVEAEGMLPTTDACELIRQAAVGLQYAHDQALVHRDVKPSNLMLTRGGVIKLLDLGLSRLRSEMSDLHTVHLDKSADGQSKQMPAELTSSQQIIGTIDYMAPEQYLDGRKADARSDVYGLGATLYKLLTGRAPYSSRKFDTLGKKLAALVGTEPTPMNINRRDLSDDLTAVLRKMLAKNPDERFQSAQEVADALEPLARGHNIGRYLEKSHSMEQLSKSKGEIDSVKPALGSMPSVHNDRDRGGIKKWLVVAAVMLFVASLAAFLTIDTPSGRLIVDVPPEARDQVQVSIANGNEIHLVDKNENWEIELHEGVWNVQLEDPSKSFKLDRNVATISSGKSEIIKVAFLPPEEKNEEKAFSSDEADESWQNLECSVYTKAYEIDTNGMIYLSELRWKVMPRYVGALEGGGRVIDDRLTIVLVDEKNSFWPVILNLSSDEAQRLHKGLTDLVANTDETDSESGSDGLVDCTINTRPYEIESMGRIVLPSKSQFKFLTKYVNQRPEGRFIEEKPTLLIEDPEHDTTPVAARMSRKTVNALLEELSRLITTKTNLPE